MTQLLKSTWFGIVFVVVSIAATMAYDIAFGPMFGEWGWVQLSIAILVLGILGVAGVSALDHQPNPYGRTNPLYNLQDVRAPTTLESTSWGWITQLLPMVLAVMILLLNGHFG